MQKQRIAVLLIIIAIAGIMIVKQATTPKPETKPPVAHAADQEPVDSYTSDKLLTGDALETALKSGRPTLAEFGLGTCATCRKMAPVLARTADAYAGKANIVSVDLDDYSATGHFYKIATMPTQIFLDAKGAEVDRHMGYMPAEEINAKLDSLGTAK